MEVGLWRGRNEGAGGAPLYRVLPLSNWNCNRLFSLGVEHSLSKRKVDGSNPSIGYLFFSRAFCCRARAAGANVSVSSTANRTIQL